MIPNDDATPLSGSSGDLDAHPGLWLAIKSACPIYIKRSVWDECSTEVEAEGGGTLDDALKNFRAIGYRSQRHTALRVLKSPAWNGGTG